MRDIFVTAIILGSLPFILRRPDLGVLMWTWISLMSPHRLAWGFAYSAPFAMIVGVTLLFSVLIWKEPKRVPWSGLTVVWLLFALWLNVTTVFALNPEGAVGGWDKSVKIQLMCFIALMVMTTPWRLKAFVWVVAFSVGFFGIKGGAFTILRGGAERVWGPMGSFIEGNNELALALITVLPLMRFLQMQFERKLIRHAFSVAMILCAASIIGSHSRGAFLAIGTMGLFLIIKSRKKAPLLFALILLVPIGVSFAPEKYWDRMSTIKTYEQDTSAMGRLNAWGFAINLIKDRPIVGGGFETFTPALFHKYAPEPDDYHDVHSIYFEILGEQGIVGFILYMTLAFLAWRAASWTARHARGDPALTWHGDLARMAQVSMVGFASGGAFLGLAYYDLYYDIIAIIVLNRLLLQRQLAAASVGNETKPASSGAPHTGARTPIYGASAHAPYGVSK